MAGDDRDTPSPRRWAELRFSVIGPLLTSPPDQGELRAQIEALARKSWCHPGSQDPITFGVSTIERWYYLAKDSDDPVSALTAKVRRDRGQQKAMSPTMLDALRLQYKAWPDWSYQLHRDNLEALCEKKGEEMGPAPSYSTVRRRMIERGWRKKKARRHPTPGQKAAEARLDALEVRSYESSHVHLLWHYDFHQGRRKVVLPDGSYHVPELLGILDDRSRYCCHLQWYLDETAETLCHGLCQAYLKRGLPRSEMHDNGAAMGADEITSAARRLGIESQPTLPYSPFQNGKQETFWETVEGRLMAMLRRVEPLELSFLNRATAAWVEQDYNRQTHSELGKTPLERMLEGPDVSRRSPPLQVLRQRFLRTRRATQRLSDGTVSIEGVRFEMPSRLRTLRRPLIGYQKWNKSVAFVLDERTEEPIAKILPLDKEKNARGHRRTLHVLDEPEATGEAEALDPVPPLLRKMLEDYAATGLPPAYLPREELGGATETDNEEEER